MMLLLEHAMAAKRVGFSCKVQELVIDKTKGVTTFIVFRKIDLVVWCCWLDVTKLRSLIILGAGTRNLTAWHPAIAAGETASASCWCARELAVQQLSKLHQANGNRFSCFRSCSRRRVKSC